MRHRSPAIAVAALGAALVSLAIRAQAQPESDSSREERPMEAMREKLLRGSPADFGITPSGEVWGVLMEIGATSGTSTVVALSDGTASLYLSTGGGVIGAGEHREVAENAKLLCQFSAAAARAAAPARTFESPAPGRVRFYFLTIAGPRWSEAPQAELERRNGEHLLAKLYHGGHIVLSSIRRRATDTPVTSALRSEDDAALRRALEAGESARVTDSDGMPALALAAMAGRAEAARLLLQHGADPNTRVPRTEMSENAPVLIFPAVSGGLPTVKALVEGGARLDLSDSTGLTALMAASYSGNDEIVAYLIARGAKLEARDQEGYTALMWAANAGHATACKKLLAAGADANARDKAGSTPIMFAAQHGFDAAVEVLLAAGADPRRKGSHGLSAIGFAQQNQHATTLRLLQR